MKTKPKLILISLSFVMAGAAYGGPIYKWTDEEGNVYFTDRPTGAATEERLEIESRPTNPATVQAQTQAWVDAAAEEELEPAADPQTPSPAHGCLSKSRSITDTT